MTRLMASQTAPLTRVTRMLPAPGADAGYPIAAAASPRGIRGVSQNRVPSPKFVTMGRPGGLVLDDERL